MTPKEVTNYVLDDALRYLYIAIRQSGAILVSIRFVHRGKKWEVDTPAEAVRLRRELEAEDAATADVREARARSEMRARSVWTPDTVWELVHSLKPHQLKVVEALFAQPKTGMWAQHLAKEIGVPESALGGVLSGLSKQLRLMELRTSDLYHVDTDWSGGQRSRWFSLEPAFRLTAEEVGWPEERRRKDAPATKRERK